MAPAGKANRNSGRLDIVCMSETIVADPVSVVIVHTAAVSFIVVPMFDTMLPNHSARNNGMRSGDRADDIANTLESDPLPVQCFGGIVNNGRARHMNTPTNWGEVSVSKSFDRPHIPVHFLNALKQIAGAKNRGASRVGSAFHFSNGTFAPSD